MAITESLTSGTSGLPEYHGMPDEQAVVQQELDGVYAIWASPNPESPVAERLEFEAKLPSVIGTLNQEERQRFDEEVNGAGVVVAKTETDFRDYGDISLEALREIFPDAIEQMAKDAEQFGFDPAQATGFTRIGKIKRGEFLESAKWHVDSPSPKEAGLRYNICSSPPTIYYAGKAAVSVIKGTPEGSMSVRPYPELDIRNGQTAVPPEYAITRATPLTVHRAPLAEEDIPNRVFIQVCFATKAT